MALIIEDGTGVTDAEAYADAAAYTTFSTDYYGAVLAGTDAEIEAAIRRTINFMNSLNWKGDPTFGRSQELAFPITGIDDITSSEIPREIIKAQHILTRAEHAVAGALAPSGKVADQRKKVKVDVIEVEYVDAGASIEAQRVTVTDAMDLLAPFLRGTTPALGGGWY